MSSLDHDPRSAAGIIFIQNADSVSAQLLNEFNAHIRDTRTVAAQVAVLIEATGAAPSFAQIVTLADTLRENPSRFWSGFALVGNFTNDDVPAFQRWMRTEGGPNKTMFWVGNNYPPPAAPWYASNIQPEIGLEALYGTNQLRVGNTWSADRDLFDMIEQSTLSGRVLVGPPKLATVALSPGQPFVLVASPIYLNASNFSPDWVSQLDPNWRTMASLPLIRCKGGRQCPFNVSRRLDAIRNGSVSDIVDFSSTMTAMTAVPIYGTTPATPTDGKPKVVPLCSDQVSPSSASSSSGSVPPEDHCMPSSGAGRFEEYKLGTANVYAGGHFISTLYTDKISLTTLQRMRFPAYLYAAEDVTSKPGFEFFVDSSIRDSMITATPASGWAATVRANGAVPASAVDSGASWSGVLTVDTSIGRGTVSQNPSSASVWRYSVEGKRNPFGGGTFLYAIDAQPEAASGDCVTRMNPSPAPGGLYKYCKPQLSPDEYAAQSQEDGTLFAQSYVMTVGNRVWHVRVSTPMGYVVPQGVARVALIAIISGAILAAVLACNAVSSSQTRQRAALMEAAQQAHQLTVSYAAHEMRNPLHSISGCMALLQDELVALKERVDDLVATAASAAAADDHGGNASSLREPLLSDADRNPETAAITRANSGTSGKAMISHESSDKGAAIKGLLLKSSSLVGPVDQLREDLFVMIGSTDQLHQVVNDFTSLAQLQRNAFSLHQRVCSLRALLKRSIQQHAPMSRAPMSFVIDDDVPDCVLCDPVRLGQILSNGLTNAAKHAAMGNNDIKLSVWVEGPVKQTDSQGRLVAATSSRLQQLKYTSDDDIESGAPGGPGASHPDVHALPVDAWFEGRSPAMCSDAEAFALALKHKPSDLLLRGQTLDRELPNPTSALEDSVANPSQKKPWSLPPRLASVRPKSASGIPEPPPSQSIGDTGTPMPDDEPAPPVWDMLWLVIEVSDNGHGLGKVSGKTLFEPFRQGKQGNDTLPAATTAAATAHDAAASSTGAAATADAGTNNGPAETDSQEAARARTRVLPRWASRPDHRAHETPTSHNAMLALVGTGLGLSLSGSLVKAMGGHIALCDLQGRTRLIIRLPLCMRDEGGAHAVSAQGSKREISVPSRSATPPKEQHAASLVKSVRRDEVEAGLSEAYVTYASVTASSQAAFGADGSSLPPRNAAFEDAWNPVLLRDEVVGSRSSEGGASPTSSMSEVTDLQQITAFVPPPVAAPAVAVGRAAHLRAVPYSAPTSAAGSRSNSGSTGTGMYSSSSSTRPPISVLAIDDDVMNRRLVQRMATKIGCSCDVLDDGDRIATALHETGQLPLSLCNLIETAAGAGARPNLQLTDSDGSSSDSPPSHRGGKLSSAKRRYDIILLDINMVRTSGLDVCRTLIEAGLDVPIVAMTANCSDVDVSAYTSAGFASTLSKPFDVGALQACINQCCRDRIGGTVSDSINF